jgi:hypothetical protein
MNLRLHVFLRINPELLASAALLRSAGHDGDGLSAFRFALYLGPHARLAEQAR